MELLSDGTVMVSDNNQGWARLTPNSSGSYTSGTWSQLASMSTIRFYDATDVLPDGRVFVLGGEFSGASNTTLAWTNTGEIYNPVTNVWSAITPFPETTFGGPTMVLSDGTVLAGSINGPNTYIYNPTTNTWSNGPTKLFNDSSKFETWTKLPDGSILSYDMADNLGAGATEAQRLDPTTMTWVDAGAVPVALGSTHPSIGPAVLLPNGQVFQIGGNGNTALYTPPTPGDGTNGLGSWAAGPVIPGGLVPTTRPRRCSPTAMYYSP